MYLQITTKCNMNCPHCCYSCSMRGKHGDYMMIRDSIAYARDHGGDECISIGGGEPTLHPKFFDILVACLTDFDYVWMATNGSQTKTMYRLRDIINQEDSIFQEDKLTIALSQDYFHDEIDHMVVTMWEAGVKRRPQGFEIRDVTRSADGVAGVGRAKRTGAGWGERCVCSELIIKPDGRIKLCGCPGSPVIGDVHSGIIPQWENVIYNNDDFNDTRCWQSIKGKRLVKRRQGVALT